MLLHCVGLASLELEKQRGIFDFYQIVDVLETRLHKLNLAFDSVIAVSYRLTHHIFLAGFKFAGKQLDKLVLNILDEVELGLSVVRHDKHSQERVGLLDARIGHLYENVGVLLKIDH